MQGVRVEPVSVAGCRGQELQAHNPQLRRAGNGQWPSHPAAWIRKPCYVADEIVLEVRKILGAMRRGEMDAANALRVMRRNVAAVATAP
jgi:hypothetical protein